LIDWLILVTAMAFRATTRVARINPYSFRPSSIPTTSSLPWASQQILSRYYQVMSSICHMSFSRYGYDDNDVDHDHSGVVRRLLSSEAKAEIPEQPKGTITSITSCITLYMVWYGGVIVSFFKSDQWTKTVGTVGALANWTLPMAVIGLPP
jgi:hypothetical protein